MGGLGLDDVLQLPPIFSLGSVDASSLNHLGQMKLRAFVDASLEEYYWSKEHPDESKESNELGLDLDKLTISKATSGYGRAPTHASHGFYYADTYPDFRGNKCVEMCHLSRWDAIFRGLPGHRIELPHSIERALQIDNETGTSLWKDALEKEWKSIVFAFNMLEAGAQCAPMYGKTYCHVVFSVEVGSLRRKARFLLTGEQVNERVIPYLDDLLFISIGRAPLGSLTDLSVGGCIAS